MAVLTSAERQAVRRDFNAHCGAAFTLSRPQMTAVIDGLDDVLDSVLVTLNAAIPQPQRSIMTTQQKVAALMLLFRERFKVA
jgi:hypothetical protein